jgi:hypothetical protein
LTSKIKVSNIFDQSKRKKKKTGPAFCFNFVQISFSSCQTQRFIEKAGKENGKRSVRWQQK